MAILLFWGGARRSDKRAKLQLIPSETISIWGNVETWVGGEIHHFVVLNTANWQYALDEVFYVRS